MLKNPNQKYIFYCPVETILLYKNCRRLTEPSMIEVNLIQMQRRQNNGQQFLKTSGSSTYEVI